MRLTYCTMKLTLPTSTILGAMILLPLVLGQTPQQLADGSTDMGFELYKQLEKDEDNIITSPYSISSALTLTYLGARTKTAEEMATVLGYSGYTLENVNVNYQSLNADVFEEQKNYIIKTANRLFGQQGRTFLESFLEPLRTYYKAPLEEKNFADGEKARKEINEWVEDQTEKKIKDLLPPNSLDASTILVLVNAIYFKGSWIQQFDPEKTKDEEFYTSASKDESVTVPMMMLENKFFKYRWDSGLKATFLRIPYDGDGNDSVDDTDDVAMYIVLPDEGVELQTVTSNLNAAEVNRIIGTMDYEQFEVMKIPRFNATVKLALKEALIAIGMPTAFGSGADFSGMGAGGAAIDQVYHDAVIEVNEEGTTAAAATAVVMKESAPMTPPKFIANRPFLYFIREESTGSTLFMGRLKKPEGSVKQGPGPDSIPVEPNSASIKSLWFGTSMVIITAILSIHLH